jgi:Uma2 family endonuclease
MGIPFRNPEPMTADEFFAFTATRPDEEKWELIDGEPVMNASSSFLHQTIASNLIGELRQRRRGKRPSWVVIPGMGVRVSETRVPVPDVIVRPNKVIVGSECDDMIVAFEVLSPSTADRDLRWKRKTYSALPSLQHYVIVAQDRMEVLLFDRSADFAEERLEGSSLELQLSSIGVSLPLSDIYADTGF